MKYTKEERLDIGRRIYDGEITRYQAAEEFMSKAYTTSLRFIWTFGTMKLSVIPCRPNEVTA